MKLDRRWSCSKYREPDFDSTCQVSRRRLAMLVIDEMSGCRLGQRDQVIQRRGFECAEEIQESGAKSLGSSKASEEDRRQVVLHHRLRARRAFIICARCAPRLLWRCEEGMVDMT
jgi:hypothetical protein